MSEGPLNLACKLCGVMIITMSGPDGVDTLVHSRPWESHNHEPVPVPASMATNRVHVCDICGDVGAVWQYRGETVHSVAGTTDGLWTVCGPCDKLVLVRDYEGIEARYENAEAPRQANAFQAMLNGKEYSATAEAFGRQTQRTLWRKYIPTIRHRERIPKPVPLPPMRPGQMPKIRDRIIEHWNSDMAAAGVQECIRADGFIAMPAQDMGMEGFLTYAKSADDDQLRRFFSRMSAALYRSDLFWISEQFTHRAVTAGKLLPDVTITAKDLPADNGFVIWETPICELPAPKPGLNVPVRAASWTVIPDGGVWITVYMQPETFISRADLTPADVRKALGFLSPWSPGGGLTFGFHDLGEIDGGRLFFRTLIATWLLMRQPGMADQDDTTKIDADVKRAYKRKKRAEPTVHLVNLRRVRRAPRRAGETEARQYTHAVKVGEKTGGFWRDYWVGPGRRERDRLFIEPYVARADLPFKDESPVPTVKVLK